MKNEFLFRKQILANTKKRYITEVWLREGQMVKNNRLDVKGFDFRKSSTSEDTQRFYTKLIMDEIIDRDEINVPNLVVRLRQFEKDIEESLLSGQKKYLTPITANPPKAYKKPLQMQQVLSVMAWNSAYPDQEIQLPEKLMVVKVDLTTLEKLEAVKEYDEKVYYNLKRGIFEHELEEVRKKGVYVIAIPTNVTEVPEWIRPFILKEEISNKILNKFFPVLESLGVKIVSNSRRSIATNIIDF